MNAHDAGLKGTLVDNGSGKATFTMKALSAGDSVSIGGKNYTIGSTATDAQKIVDAQKKAGGKVTVNGVEYTYNDTDSKWNDAAGKEVKIGTGAAAGEIKIGAGDKVSDGTTTLTAMTDAKDATGAANADGIDDNDNSVITAEKAYSLAKDELVAANHIGDTENTAAVAQDTTNKNVFTITTGSAKVANTLSFSLHVGADADMTNKITVDIDTMNSANLGIKGLNVTDKNGTAATYAIDAISDAISKVSSQRSALGAVQNRLEHTIDNLDNISENTSSAESRIRDTDMAKEMVNYSKNNILAQAGQSMLAQANQSNQGVLSLLQ